MPVARARSTPALTHRPTCHLACGLLAVWALSTACHHDGPPAPRRLSAEGSSTLFPFVTAAAKAFHDASGTTIDIVDSDSGKGIKKLAQGTTLDFANASRPVKEAELDAGLANHKMLHMTTVAVEGVAVIVHPSNPVRGLTRDQLRKLFFGPSPDWSELGGPAGPVHVIGIDPKESGTGDFFIEQIGGKGASYVPAVKLVRESYVARDEVAGDPLAISFCGDRVARDARDRVTIIAVNGIVPSERSLLDTSYPIGRKLFVVTDGPPSGEVGEFIKFLLSEAGQGFARQRGYTPIALGGLQ
jgi:phosphate transport system substrate-binding protein